MQFTLAPPVHFVCHGCDLGGLIPTGIKTILGNGKSIADMAGRNLEVYIAEG